MFQRYKIDIDYKDFFHGLDILEKDIKKIARRMMGKVAVAIKKDTKNKNLKGGVLKKQEGLLLKSLKHKTKSDFSATISSNSPYASTHEKGMTILPKNGDYLAFQIDGKWKRVKKVTIPQRPFLYPVIDDYFTTNKAEKVMEEILDLALKEIFGE